MNRRPAPSFIATALIAALCVLPAASCQQRVPERDQAAGSGPGTAALQISTIADGLEHPWALAFLPGGDFLVSERGGALRRISADGTLSAPLDGVPQVWAHGQGGLLDLALSPDFATDKRVYFTYSEPGPDGTAGTAIAHGTLGDDGLSDVRVIFRQQPKLDGPNHFGSRLAFDRQGYLFVTLGERNDKTRAQRLDGLQGKVVRINADGSVPADNPFVGKGNVDPAIWSYGHRNPQSAAIDPRSGRYWEAEHGPQGGDEINRPEAGKNYGWPVISDGNDYGTGRPYPETIGKSAPGMERPYHVWPVSPGLSGMAFFTGHPSSAWNDSLFVGALAQKNLIRLSLDGDRIRGEERLLGDRRQRIRDVRVGPDGNVYVLTDENDGELIRIVPPAM